MAKTRFTGPVMRMVQGSVDEPQTTDQQGNPRVIKTGPNAGQPNPQYYIGGAIAKGHPEWPAFWAVLVDQAMVDFPNLFPHGAAGRDAIVALGGPTAELLTPRPCAVSAINPAGQPMPLCMHREFAFKVVDGDGYDSNMKAHNTKEGFGGCWVVRFASSYPPRCFFAGRYAPSEQIQEKGAIRRGFYVRVNGTVEGNGQAARPGLYVNLDLVELAGVGPEIISGPDAGTAFGAGPGALPPGATAMPAGTAPAGAAPPPPPAAGGYAPPPPPPPAAAAPPPPPAPVVQVDPMAAARAAGWAPHPSAPGYHYLGNEVVTDADVAARFNAAAPVAPLAPPPPPVAPVAPYEGFMQPPAVPAAPAASPPPPVPTPPASPTASPTSGPVMLPAANGATYDAMIAAGWTDATLRANGMMA